MTENGACGPPLFAPRLGTLQCSVIEQSGVAASGSGCRGHGAAPRAGFWVLLGGPKVPPRAAVLRMRIRRRTSTRVARNGRRPETRRYGSSLNPTFLLEKKGAVDGTKENLAGDRSPCTPPSAPQGDCGPPNAPSNPLGTGDGSFCTCDAKPVLSGGCSAYPTMR